jgi:NAD(P)-dependent dehydrogenase (short-subunit alcohol dehydrogenase family)
MGRLSGRCAIVTGGAVGIGRHYSLALAAEGARVMIADIAEGGDLAREIVAKHGANTACSAFCDVSDEKAVKMAVATALDRFGKIDVLVNNAAVYSTLTEMPFTEIDVDTWDRVMDVNVRGMFLMSKYVAPVMIAQRSGKIINIGSGTALRGIPNLLHYVTSKGAVMALTRALSRELGDYGICVNTLMPGFTLSDSILANNPAHVSSAREPAIQRRAIKRDERPEDLLGALIFLASSESDFITGQNIAVDGGAVNT